MENKDLTGGECNNSRILIQPDYPFASHASASVRGGFGTDKTGPFVNGNLRFRFGCFTFFLCVFFAIRGYLRADSSTVWGLEGLGEGFGRRRGGLGIGRVDVG